MAIEVEKRGLLDEVEFGKLPEKILTMGGVEVGANDTESMFYVIPGGQLKVQLQTSKNTAKIAWKSGDFDGASSRRELEVNFNPDDYRTAMELIEHIIPGPVHKVPTRQRRTDYKLNGLGVALKYSEHWGYHIEIDVVVTNQGAVDDALDGIHRVADRLGIELLTEAEEKAYVQNMLKNLS